MSGNKLLSDARLGRRTGCNSCDHPIATIIVNGKPVGNVPATIYVDGIQLPEYAAQDLLTTLYTQQGGTTRTLMAAVAQQESQLQQFNWTGRWAYSPLWRRDGYWPTESYDIKNGNGSHIGLMQMPTNMVDAYNWSQNASDGVNFFYQQKLNGKAKAYEAELHQQCPSLPAFTAGDTEWTRWLFTAPEPQIHWVPTGQLDPIAVNGS